MARALLGAAVVATAMASCFSQSVPMVACPSPLAGTLYDYSAPLLNGTTVDFSQYAGKVVIVANVATY